VFPIAFAQAWNDVDDDDCEDDDMKEQAMQICSEQPLTSSLTIDIQQNKTQKL